MSAVWRDPLERPAPGATMPAPYQKRSVSTPTRVIALNLNSDSDRR